MNDLERRPVEVDELVRVLQGAEDVGQHDQDRLRRQQGARTLDDLAQWLAVEILHGEKALAVVNARVQDLDDVRMIETSAHASLVEKQCAELRVVCEMRPYPLHDDELRDRESIVDT